MEWCPQEAGTVDQLAVTVTLTVVGVTCCLVMKFLVLPVMLMWVKAPETAGARTTVKVARHLAVAHSRQSSAN